MNKKLNIVIKQYLDKELSDLECFVSEKHITWYKNGKPFAGVSKDGYGRLRLANYEFKFFINSFSLSWNSPEDDKVLLDMIVPYLKFDGGTPAIDVLVKLGYMEELTNIGLPSYWD
jgi:hypothetical protein